MKFKLKNDEIKQFLSNEESKLFPKYSTQIINLANQNAQGTRPKVVGQLSDLIQEFSGSSIEEWKEWYCEKKPTAVDDATTKIWSMIENLQTSANSINQSTVKDWVEDLIFVKTFLGLKFQAAILKKIADARGTDYELAGPENEAKGIDGFIGDQPYSIKPTSYKTKDGLNEIIGVPIIYYEKKKNGIDIEFPD